MMNPKTLRRALMIFVVVVAVLLFGLYFIAQQRQPPAPVGAGASSAH